MMLELDEVKGLMISHFATRRVCNDEMMGAVSDYVIA